MSSSGIQEISLQSVVPPGEFLSISEQRVFLAVIASLIVLVFVTAAIRLSHNHRAYKYYKRLSRGGEHTTPQLSAESYRMWISAVEVLFLVTALALHMVIWINNV